MTQDHSYEAIFGEPDPFAPADPKAPRVQLSRVYPTAHDLAQMILELDEIAQSMGGADCTTIEAAGKLGKIQGIIGNIKLWAIK